MAELTYMCGFGESPSLTFYIEATNLSFDYAAQTKTVRIRVIAQSEADQIVTLSASGACGLSVFGTRYSLPSSIKFAKGKNVFLNKTISEVSDITYPSAAIAELVLTYNSDVYGDLIGQSKTTFTFPRMYYTPELKTDKTRYALGSSIILSGDMLSEGYTFSVSVSPVGGDPLLFVTVGSDNVSVPTYHEWIADHANNSEFDAVVRIEGGMPNVQEIPVTLYLLPTDGAPEATVQADYVSSSPIADALPYGVKNRSSLTVKVTDIVCKYGASLESCLITYNGVDYSATEFNTGILTDTAERVCTVFIKDSRGLGITYYVTTDVREYAPPEFSAEVYRSDENGNASTLGGSVALLPTLTKSFPLDGNNTYRFLFSMHEASGKAVISETEIANGVRFIADNVIDPYVSYEVTVRCEDSIGSVTECKYLLEATRVEFNIAKNRIGIGKYAEKEYLLDSAWSIKSGGDIIFTDYDEREVSLADIFSGGYTPVMWKSYSASSEAELSAALTAENDGLFIAVINVTLDGLSLSKGDHTVLKYRLGSTEGYKEL